MRSSFNTLAVEAEGQVCTIRFNRPEARNTINEEVVAELSHALHSLDAATTVVVLEGSATVFSFGADFQQIDSGVSQGTKGEQNAGALYDVWLQLATGRFVTVAHVRGQANAGGMGFVAACDIVLADSTALFSLSELLFGLYPACVLPFLIRRVGFQKAHYMTLMTQPISVEQAHNWGLVDAYETNSRDLLRRHLLRLRRLSPVAVARYKLYAAGLTKMLTEARDAAIAGNREVFTDSHNLQMISRYVQTGLFPWEQ
jgi:polyketide biosynthesis enoyl-CoA hydratase PksH